MPRTSPRHTVKIAMMVSMEMSIGRAATAEIDGPWDVSEDSDAVLVEWRAECSWAE